MVGDASSEQLTPSESTCKKPTSKGSLVSQGVLDLLVGALVEGAPQG